jgi:hypothetical protein
LGIKPPGYNPEGECEYRYQGVLCSECIKGFSRNSDYECNKCPKTGKNISRLIFIFFAAVILVSFLIRSTLDGAKEKKNVNSIYTKILMNHLQLILLTQSFRLKWP